MYKLFFFPGGNRSDVYFSALGFVCFLSRLSTPPPVYGTAVCVCVGISSSIPDTSLYLSLGIVMYAGLPPPGVWSHLTNCQEKCRWARSTHRQDRGFFCVCVFSTYTTTFFLFCGACLASSIICRKLHISFLFSTPTCLLTFPAKLALLLLLFLCLS